MAHVSGEALYTRACLKRGQLGPTLEQLHTCTYVRRYVFLYVCTYVRMSVCTHNLLQAKKV